ncbi:glycosyltransferase family 52 [Edwardsiella hoshinae]|uniref:glycosyltransferase family 52 n=1 Tax=Edwardsiella hoshinae TaxID=93378 RepID=UPI0009F23416|nr:glycosyltransferase family 52 [Edwardsiella hoshinae]
MDLYICLTPLQTLIAAKIKQERSNNAQSIFFFNRDNAINRKYYNELNKLMVSSIEFATPFSLRMIFKLRQLFKNKEFDTIFFANIDHPAIHYILSFIKFNRIETFDDGTLNISYNGRYYSEVVCKKWKLFCHSLLGRRFNQKRVISETRLHHTIYKNRRNIIGNTHFIDLFSHSMHHHDDLKNCISLFLGGVYSEMTYDKSDGNKIALYVSDFLQKNNDIYYIPHPRENPSFFNRYFLPSEYQNMISEHIIMLLREKYSVVNVYGMASTVQFNVFDMPGVNCILIKSKFLDEITVENIKKLITMGALCIDF